MSDKSGWCSGWGPKHDGCKWALCRCSCHGETAAREGDSGGECGTIRAEPQGRLRTLTAPNPALLDVTERRSS